MDSLDGINTSVFSDDEDDNSDGEEFEKIPKRDSRRGGFVVEN